MKEGSSIIDTASVEAYRGNPKMLDYGSTKGATVSWIRGLSTYLIDRKIRVNGVAPGCVWTPLIAATFSDEDIASFGSSSTMNRASQPYEIAPCYVFLASDDSSYITGQVLHPNGGVIINT
ncbi:glucose and ribitol dehydrogenase-like protein [Tanacetum coccineum]